MAKVSFSKLGLKKVEGAKTVQINGNSIEVKQYLPINEKAELIGDVLYQANDDNNFISPLRLEVCTYLEIIKKYSNLSFTEKQLEDTGKLYDLLDSNGVLVQIINQIPKEEFEFITELIESSAEATMKYANSFMGMMKSITQDYNGINGIEEIMKKVQNRDGLSFLSELYAEHGPVQA